MLWALDNLQDYFQEHLQISSELLESFSLNRIGFPLIPSRPNGFGVGFKDSATGTLHCLGIWFRRLVPCPMSP